MRMITAQDILRVVEPIVYGKRRLMMGVLLVITAALAWQASKTHVDAGFEKSLPLNHPYMETFRKYQEAFGGANTILVAVIQKDGNIYNEHFLDTLKKVTDEVFFLPGIDRARVQSLFTPNVRYIEVVEGGFAGGNVIPADYAPSPEMFDLVRSNVGKAQIIGRLVTNDQRGAMVVAELLERDPVTGQKLDYREVSKNLEAKIRDVYQKDDISIHIIGFAKVIGDVTDAANEVVMFFAIAFVMTGFLLWLYLGSFQLMLLPMTISLVAVIWEFGLLYTAGYGLDPFAILVPFLILSVSVSHGVQYVSSWVSEIVDHGRNGFDASLETFRRLAIPGTTALITDVAGFITIYLIEINIIREMSLNATFGMAAIIITNKIMMPIWLTYMKIRNPVKFKEIQLKRERMGDGMWRALANVTEKRNATIMVVLTAMLLGFSYWKSEQIKYGDFKRGVPELRPDSRYNNDNNAIADNFAIGTDILKVIVETVPEGCIKYDVMEKVDRFAWRMDNTRGVASTISLPGIAKIINSGWNEGSLKWRILPRNQYVIVQSINPIDTSYGLFNPDCSAMPVIVFTEDHKYETIKHIVTEVEKFDAENRNSDGWRPPEDAEAKAAWTAPQPGTPEFGDGPYIEFKLATGNVGVMAATNDVVHANDKPIAYWVYAVIFIFVLLSFKNVSGLVCIMLPLVTVTLTTYALMTMLEIGLKVATLPVTALAAGIGVDYGLYIYSVMEEKVKEGMSLKEAYYSTLHLTGKAVLFTGISLGGSVATWLFSGLQFQADMGKLLCFAFTANMVGAVFVLPALAVFFMKVPGTGKLASEMPHTGVLEGRRSIGSSAH